jgi:tetratricopeptide (TPR) repeat protein
MDAQRHADSYQDFVVDLGSPSGDGYPVRVLESPAGEGRGSFSVPWSREELEGVWEGLARRGRSRGWRDVTAFLPGGGSPDARVVGRELFEALFRGEVGDRFLAAWHRARATGKGLRIKIRLDPERPEALRLHGLPWELLCRPESGPGAGTFLARSRWTPVVRYLEAAEAAVTSPVPRPLRILVVMAEPRGAIPLDLERERRRIEEVWRPHRAVEVDFLPREKGDRATLRELRRTLLEREVHVLHFMGHGGFGGEEGEGTLSFEDERGELDPVSGEALGEVLDDFDPLRLVVLNACHSAQATDAEGRNPLTGVAVALATVGVPAVVAMQAAISDRAAIAFSRELYHRLAAGDPIEAAVVEGRRAIGRPGRTAEWGTPVLFLRAREGRIFGGPPSGERVERPREWSWNLRGAVFLAAGGAGVALLAGFGYLLLGEHPAARSAVAVAAAVLAALFGWAVEHDPIPWRRLSHRVARSGPVRWGLAGLTLAAAALWAFAGGDALCRARCGELCTPPGVRQLLVGDFTAELPGEAGVGWGKETARFLHQKLAVVDSLRPLAAPTLDEGRARRCVDVAVHGRVREDGAELVLEADLSRRGVHLATVAARGRPEAGGGELLALQNRLALGVLEALGVTPDGPLRERILSTPTRDPEALELARLGVASFLGDELAVAEVRFRAALDRDPGYADAANNLGVVRLRQGETAAAVELFRRAVELFPRHPSYHFNLGLALDDAGQRDAAAAAYQRALELDPTHARAANNLGLVRLLQGELGAARESLERGLAYARDERLESVLHKNLGRLALERGRPAVALEQLEAAIGRFELYPEARFYRAVALGELGRTAEACSAWGSYLAVAGSDDDAERRLEAERRRAELGCDHEGKTREVLRGGTP